MQNTPRQNTHHGMVSRFNRSKKKVNSYTEFNAKYQLSQLSEIEKTLQRMREDHQKKFFAKPETLKAAQGTMQATDNTQAAIAIKQNFKKTILESDQKTTQQVNWPALSNIIFSKTSYLQSFLLS